DYAGTVGPDELHTVLCLVAPHVALHLDHVLGRNAVGDGNAQADTGIGRLHDGVSGERWRHEDDAGGCASVANGVANRIEDRQAKVGGAALAGCHTAHDPRAVIHHLLGMKAADLARDTLDNDAGIGVKKHAHDAALNNGCVERLCCQASTTFCAASASVSAAMIGKLLASRIRRPSSAWVPASRTTSGTFISTLCSAWTMPWATQSQRLIPAKMFTRIACTRSSESTRLKALATRSGVAPPPMSRKLAGSPPACLIMSMVAMARPAPLMMQPMLPSRPT